MKQPANARDISFVVLVLIAFGIGAPIPGCGVDMKGAGQYDLPCAADVQCDDRNPCTSDICGQSGVCIWKRSDVAAPDDGNVCTSERCEGVAYAVSHVNEGASCLNGLRGGRCRAGACVVVCDAQNQLTACDDRNACTVDTCDLTHGICANAKLDGTATPGVSPVLGDCRKTMCVVGKETTVVDDKDLPVKSDCWDAACASGTASKMPSKAGTACGWQGGLACDGKGKCIGCVSNDQCPKDGCNKGVCNAGVCGLDPLANGTLLPASEQTPQDCRSLQCDGAGNPYSASDPSDRPAPDAKECTNDLCLGGTPQHPDRNAGASCSQHGGTVCDDAGACVACNSEPDCPDPGNCSVRTCDNHSCGVSDKPFGEPCGPGNGVCDGSGQCVGCNGPSDCPQGGACTAANCASNICGTTDLAADIACPAGFCDGAGQCVQCNGTAQCPVPTDPCSDSVCSSHACGAVLKPGGTQCDGTHSCDANGQCVGCLDASSCPGQAECTRATCTNGACGTTPEAASKTCGTSLDRHCDGAGNCVECNDQSQCSGASTCRPVACQSNTCQGTNASKGLACGAGKECDGDGSCKSLIGVVCAVAGECLSGYCVDGVCCDVQCAQFCYACSATGKAQGSDGTCGPVKDKSDPALECPAAKKCNGSGDCT